MHTVFKVLATLFNGAMLASCIPSLAYIPWPASLIMVVMALIYMLMIIAIYRSHVVLKLLTVVACLFQLFNLPKLYLYSPFEIAMTLITVGGPVVTLLAVFGARKPEAAPATPAAPSTTDNPA